MTPLAVKGVTGCVRQLVVAFANCTCFASLSDDESISYLRFFALFSLGPVLIRTLSPLPHIVTAHRYRPVNDRAITPRRWPFRNTVKLPSCRSNPTRSPCWISFLPGIPHHSRPGLPGIRFPLSVLRKQLPSSAQLGQYACA